MKMTRENLRKKRRKENSVPGVRIVRKNQTGSNSRLSGRDLKDPENRSAQHPRVRVQRG